MRPSAARALGILSREALADGVRRRIVPVIAVVSLLSLLLVDSCTSCAAATIVKDGQTVALPEVAAWTGMVIYAVLALWILVLAGILGADHLAETLADGSAGLVLARPVSRGVFAAARLFGALAIALCTGALLLGATAALMYARHGTALGAAAWAGLACAVGAGVVCALAMLGSLTLPRIATSLLVLVGVGAIAGANAASLAGANLGGLPYALDRFGPPLLAAVVAPLAAWIEPVEIQADPFALLLRLLLWAGASWGLLLLAFRRVELGR